MPSACCASAARPHNKRIQTAALSEDLRLRLPPCLIRAPLDEENEYSSARHFAFRLRMLEKRIEHAIEINGTYDPRRFLGYS